MLIRNVAAIKLDEKKGWERRERKGKKVELQFVVKSRSEPRVSRLSSSEESGISAA
jgi:hypothetical protein